MEKPTQPVPQPVPQSKAPQIYSREHAEWLLIKDQARIAIASGLLPRSIDTPEKAAIIALKGRELGIPIMQALSSISVINGKPALSAELMLALIYQKISGFRLTYKETTNERCTVEAHRPGHEAQVFTFTLQDAHAAGLTSNPSWKRFPAAMLRARCISAMARAVAPDATMGMATKEELGEEGDEDLWTNQAPVTTSTGTTKALPPKEVAKEPPKEVPPQKASLPEALLKETLVERVKEKK